MCRTDHRAEAAAMQSRNDSVKTSKARRFFTRSRARRPTREMSVNSTPGVPTRGSPGARGTFAHARSVHPGAVPAVVDEHRAFALATQRTVAARHAGRGAGQRDVRSVVDFLGSDHQAHVREAHGIPAE